MSTLTLGPDGTTIYGLESKSFREGYLYSWSKDGKYHRIARFKGNPVDSAVLFTSRGSILVTTQSSGSGGYGQVLEIKGY